MAQPTAEIRAERRRLRALRLALPRQDRLAAEREIASTLRRLPVFRRGRRVAVYLALPGEASLARALAAAHASGAAIYVPQVTSRRLGRMRFLRLRRDRERRWRRPRLFGIAFACQEVSRIDSSPSDVALDLVVTEREFIVPRRRPVRPPQEDPT